MKLRVQKQTYPVGSKCNNGDLSLIEAQAQTHQRLSMSNEQNGNNNGHISRLGAGEGATLPHAPDRRALADFFAAFATPRFLRDRAGRPGVISPTG